MSEEIEDKLKEIFKKVNFIVEKETGKIGVYNITCYITGIFGFTINYYYDKKFTFSSNIEQIKSIINKMLLKQFRNEE